MPLTKFQEQIYNTWLYETRQRQNKPFTARKTFKDITLKDRLALRRIETMLRKHQHIKLEQYFKAPFEIYPEQEYFDLSYFASMKGIRSLTIYLKKLQEQPVDEEYHLQQIASSLKFIAKFCHDNKITLDEYIDLKEGITYSWCKHVKTRKITIYILMEFSGIYNKIIEMPDDEREILLGDQGKYFLGYKDRYLKSQTAKILVKRGLERIKEMQKRTQ